MAERCEIHGLAAGPDRRCVLCRRDEGRSRTRASLAWLLFGGLVVVGAIALIAWRLRDEGDPLLANRELTAPNDERRATSGEALGEPGEPGSESTNAEEPRDDTSEKPPSLVTAIDAAGEDSPAPDGSAEPAREPSSRRLEITERDPRGLVAELRARGERDAATNDYPATGESAEVYVPAAAAAGEPHGVLVWIHAGPSGAVPSSYRAVLDERRLLWVGPNRAGNEREVSARIGLALDALSALRREHAVDDGRVYVGGFSGGAKSALRTLLYYPDVFRGGVLACGAEYVRPVSVAGGRVFPARIGQPRDLDSAKGRPSIFLTGSKDFNREQILGVADAMTRDGFSRAIVIDLNDLGHTMPPAAALAQMLDRL